MFGQQFDRVFGESEGVFLYWEHFPKSWKSSAQAFFKHLQKTYTFEQLILRCVFLKNKNSHKNNNRKLNVDLLETYFFLKKNFFISMETRVRIYMFFVFLKFTKFSSSVFALNGFLKIKNPFKAKTLEENFVNFGKSALFWTKISQ